MIQHITDHCACRCHIDSSFKQFLKRLPQPLITVYLLFFIKSMKYPDKRTSFNEKLFTTLPFKFNKLIVFIFFPSFYFVFYGSDFLLLKQKHKYHTVLLSQKKSILYMASCDRDTPDPHWMQVQ